MRKRQKLGLDEFIQRSNIIHSNYYDYSKTVYTGYYDKIIITCPIHGDFQQSAGDHLAGYGCNKCGCLKQAQKKTKTTEWFIENAIKVHGNKYDYSKVIYTKLKDKVEIICPIHGSFWQNAGDHIKGIGCEKCGREHRVKDSLQERTMSFLEKANIIHKGTYDYSKVNYIDNKTKVEIICPIHGSFWQRPKAHLSQANGCPLCKESQGEKHIRAYLKAHNIEFIYQKIFNDCKYRNNLRFDFYIPNKNICIEFDGMQHYKPIEYFGGEKTLKETQERDRIKTLYCQDNNIKLIRIKYTKLNKLEEILDKQL